MSDGYRVLIDELVIEKVMPIVGKHNGWRHGPGEHWKYGDVIPADALNPEWVEALERGQGALFDALSDFLEPASNPPAPDDPERPFRREVLRDMSLTSPGRWHESKLKPRPKA